MPEKPGTQNTAACENQVKQQELSDHWKLIKMYFFLKKMTRMMQQRQKDWLKYKF